MVDKDPEPNNPLSPYFPSEVPDFTGKGRKWFAILLTLMLLLGASFGFLSLLFPP